MTVKPAPDVDGDCAIAISFARIAGMSSPIPPPGLAERVIRDVPRLAQMPAPCAPLRARALRAVTPVRADPIPPVRYAAAGRRAIAGWTALAAGLAAIALMVPTGLPVRPVAHAVHAPPLIARNQAIPLAVTPVSAVKSPASHPARAHSVYEAAPIVPDSRAVIPAMAEQPAPLQLAVAVPAPVPVAAAGPVYGPVDTEARSPGPGMPGGSGAGTAAGFAFAGHDSGVSPH